MGKFEDFLYLPIEKTFMKKQQQQKTKHNKKRTTFLNHTILAHVLCHQEELPPPTECLIIPFPVFMIGNQKPRQLQRIKQIFLYSKVIILSAPDNNVYLRKKMLSTC